MKQKLLLALFALLFIASGSKATKFENPVINADVPDPDVIRVGDTFYMVSTTMHLMPGAPIMKSKDLVNWEIASYVFDRLTDTPNYDLQLLKQGYQKLYKMVREHNPQAKIVLLTGSMLYNQEQKEAKRLLDTVMAEAHHAGDREVYRFDMTQIMGDEGYGNDWHPNVWQDEKMANELAPFLRELMNWY